MHHLTSRVLAAFGCSGMGLRFWFDTFFPKKPNPIFSVPWHAVGCCGMFQNPHQQAPKQGAAACCSMLRHASTVGASIVGYTFNFSLSSKPRLKVN